MSHHQGKQTMVNDGTCSGMLAYCNTCNCEITCQEYYDYHHEAKHDITDAHNYMPKRNGEVLANIICECCNSQDRFIIAQGFVKGMLNQHRTLQDYTIFMLREILIQYGKLGDEHVDGRNEHARKVAKLMGDAW